MKTLDFIPAHMKPQFPDAIRSDRYIDLAMGSAKVLDRVLDAIADQHIESNIHEVIANPCDAQHSEGCE